jgi:hypothetical protein
MVLLHQTVTTLRRLSVLLIVLSLASLVSTSPNIFPSVHALGLVYVNPATIAVGISGNIITTRVQVAGVDPFTGWDIQVQSNQSVINPTSLSIAGNMLVTNYTENVIETVNCINGISYTASPCDSSDGPGTVHSAARGHGGNPPTNPVSGLLFTINYTVAGSGSYSPLQIQRSIITNGTNLISVTKRDSSYGIPPGQGFILTTNQDSVSIPLGSKANVTLSLSSSGGYSGMADLTLETHYPGLLFSFNETSIPLSPTHSNNATMTVTTDSSYAASHYMITITATSNGLSHTATLSILTTDFTITASPSILKIHATSSGRSIITLDTQSGFSGPIRLDVTKPAVPGLTASLGTVNLLISAGRPATTNLDIRIPDSIIPFVYLVNITATSQSSSHTITVVVQPPSPDFSFLLSGADFVVQAGESRTFTLTMTSIDYFKGQLNLSAPPLYWASEAFSRPEVVLDFGNSSTSTMTLTTDVNSALGDHIVTLTATGTTFLGTSVTHLIFLIVTITQLQPSKTILSLPPLTFYGIIGALCLVPIIAALRRVRKLQHG